jgi:type I restriction enzyme S subunit
MKTVKLSDVCDISSGGTPSRNNPEFFKGDIPWAKISDIEAADNGFIYTTGECITADGLKNIRGKLFPRGTLLFAMYGSIGKVAFAGIELSANQAILGIRPKADDQIDLKYLKCWFESNKQRLINQGQGVALKNLSATIVRNLRIELPPLNDQKRIAHLLGKVEGLIARRKHHLQQLDDLLKSVFLEMFGDPITNPRKFPVRKLSEFYINPKEGTKCGPFGSALKRDELVDSGIPVWNMDNIDPSGRMLLPFRMWITKEKYEELATYSVIDGDIIISRAGTVGKMCVAKMDGRPAIISTNLIRLRLGDKLRPLYVVSLMIYCKGRVGRLKTGADGAFTHMNTRILDKLEFPYPPTELQDQFAAIVEKVEALKFRYQQSLTDLESLYGALSQKAFKGELDLSRVVLPAEEPEIAEEETTDIEEQPMESLFELPAPEELALLQTAEGRKALLGEWLNAWLAHLGDAPFSAQAFMDAARQRLWELADDDAPDWGAAEYDELKTQVFEALEQGRLTQGYDDANNRVQITAVKG